MALSASNSAIYIYGEVEAGDEVFLPEMLANITSTEIDVRISSPGGSIMAGLAIYNLLRFDDRRVIVWIDGMAGSIASVIAMAGDEINIAENGFFFLHNPLSMAPGGNAKELRETADILDKITPSLISAYKTRVKDEAKLIELMNGESYLNADESLALGLADFSVESLPLAACHAMKIPKLSAKLLTAAAKISKPTAGKDEPKTTQTMSEDTKTPAVDPAAFNALAETVAKLVADLAEFTKKPEAEPEPEAKENAELVALRKELDEVKAKMPTAAAIKPDAIKATGSVREQYLALMKTNPLEAGKFYAANSKSL